MTFYTLNYIQNNQNTDRAIFYILMLVAASAMIIFTVLYLRDRFNTRYRDLGIIALLLFCRKDLSNLSFSIKSKKKERHDED